jgi:hypothetical protein
MDWESCVEGFMALRRIWSGRFPVHERVVARLLGFRGSEAMPAHKQLRMFIAVCKKGKCGKGAATLSCTSR